MCSVRERRTKVDCVSLRLGTLELRAPAQINNFFTLNNLKLLAYIVKAQHFLLWINIYGSIWKHVFNPDSWLEYFGIIQIDFHNQSFA